MPYVAKPKPSIFKCTSKQMEVMRHVLEAADAGRFLNLKELIRLISWGPIKGSSMSNQIRHLEAHGFLKRLYGEPGETDVSRMIPGEYGEQEKIRGLHMRIVPTPYAYTFFRPGTASR